MRASYPNHLDYLGSSNVAHHKHIHITHTTHTRYTKRRTQETTQRTPRNTFKTHSRLTGLLLRTPPPDLYRLAGPYHLLVLVYPATVVCDNTRQCVTGPEHLACREGRESAPSRRPGYDPLDGSGRLRGPRRFCWVSDRMGLCPSRQVCVGVV